MLISMTNSRHDQPLGEQQQQQQQLELALPRRIAPPTRQVPAQLRLDARTRQIGRAGIAEIRRIIAANTVSDAGSKAA